MNEIASNTTAVILCGGRGQRMGGQDKGLQNFKGVPLALHALMRIQPQVSETIINANRNIGVYEGFGVPVVCDQTSDFPGPLAGIQTALTYTNQPYVLSIPCDVPLFPGNLVEKLSMEFQANHSLELATVITGGRTQPVFCLMKSELIESLNRFLRRGDRKIDLWFEELNWTAVEFPNASEFHNVNTLDELKTLEKLNNE